MHALALAFLSMSVLHAVYTSQIIFFEHSPSHCASPWVVSSANSANLKAPQLLDKWHRNNLPDQSWHRGRALLRGVI